MHKPAVPAFLALCALNGATWGCAEDTQRTPAIPDIAAPAPSPAGPPSQVAAPPVGASESHPKSPPLSSEGGMTARYRLSFERRRQHLVDVEAHFPALPENTDSNPGLELMMPVWTPGSYLVREYARHIEGEGMIATERGSDKPLAITKVRKNRWRIDTDRLKPVTLRYSVYCNRLAVQGNFVDEEMAVLNGAALFLTPVNNDADEEEADDDPMQHPYVVHLTLPTTWSTAVTGLPHDPGKARLQFISANYDVLVDSPIVAGNPIIHDFVVAGVGHRLVNLGGGKVWDEKRSARDVAHLTKAHTDFWGVTPYTDYTFLNIIADAHGGLEHLNSTLILTDRWRSSNREDYLSWLGLVSHEFFHTWNVKRLRPVALGPFDYEQEVHTKSLWIAEGITSYYDDLLLRRARLMTVDEYLERLSKNINRLHKTPGRKAVSLELASYDAWIKYYRRDENTRNTSVSYYTKGAVVAFLLDAKIRALTENKRSLDDVMRIAYQRFSGTTGFTAGGFQELVGQIAPSPEWAGFFSTAVRGTAELDYKPALDFFGFGFAETSKTPAEREDKSAGVQDAADDPPKDEDQLAFSDNVAQEPEPGSLGIRHKTLGKRIVVQEVARGGPSYHAGIHAGDELLAVGGFRVLDGQLSKILSAHPPGSTVELLVSRRGIVHSLSLKLEKARAKEAFNLERLEHTSARQRKNLALWLGFSPADSIGAE